MPEATHFEGNDSSMVSGLRTDACVSIWLIGCGQGFRFWNVRVKIVALRNKLLDVFKLSRTAEATAARFVEGLDLCLATGICFWA